MKIKQIFEKAPLEQVVTVKAWVRSVRKSKKVGFVVLNDGSVFESLQVVFGQDEPGFEQLSKVSTGACLEVTGKIVASQGKGQSVEMHGESLVVLGSSDSEYPLQKKGTSLEFLREISHLRSRTNIFGSVFRLRHVLAKATHDFFDECGFYYVNTPILTERDLDKFMERTKDRALPSGRLSARFALIQGLVLSLIGLLGLGMIDGLWQVLLGLTAFASYLWMYTPLKSKTPWAMVIGA